jgi:uncharacterized protein
MIVDLPGLSQPELAFNFNSEPDLEEEAARLTVPAAASGRLVNHAGYVEVEGLIRGTIELDCTRCLKPIIKPLGVKFKVDYVRKEDYATDIEAEVRPESLDTAVYDDEKIDLGELVREQIVLDLPAQIFCRPDCKGLCVTCGADLNDGPCECRGTEIDPRWAALKNLN